MYFLAPACFLFALVLVVVSGVIRQFRPSAILLISGCGIIFGCSVSAMLENTWFVNLPYFLPEGSFALQMDAIAAWFLLPMSLLPPILMVYGEGHWGKTNPLLAQRYRLLLGFATASLLIIPVAAHAIFFVLAWELVAIFGFLLIIAGDTSDKARHAGWIYLASSHASVMCLIAAFCLMATANGGGFFATLPVGWAHTGAGKACFLLFTIGFAIKSGISPFHFWLPEAHGIAPCQVAAFSSGLVVKIGLFGFFRLLMWVPDPPLWWAGCILLLGVLSALLGAINSVVQKDYTRFLAFSTVENMGVVAIALSIAFAGKSLNQPVLMALGIAGGLVHVLNHCIIKPLLFLTAGSILRITGSRNLELLGGLAKQQPRLAFSFFLGAVCICGLPPLFGFVGKWIILLGAFEGFTNSGWIWSAIAMSAVIFAGSLSVIAFARTFGIAFLGESRYFRPKKTSIPTLMKRPMLILVLFAVAISILPMILPPTLQPVLNLYDQTNTTMNPFPFFLNIVPIGQLWFLTCLLVFLGAFLWWRVKKTVIRHQPTWDCGYAKNSPRIQYTASSFAQILRDLFSVVLLHKKAPPNTKGVFPAPSQFSTESHDMMLHNGLNPAFRGSAGLLARLRIAQGGLLPIYLLYIVITLLALLAWTLA